MCDTMGHLLIFLCLTAVVSVKSKEEYDPILSYCTKKNNVTKAEMLNFKKNDNSPNEGYCVVGCTFRISHSWVSKEDAIRDIYSLEGDQLEKMKTCHDGIDLNTIENCELGKKLKHCEDEIEKDKRQFFAK